MPVQVGPRPDRPLHALRLPRRPRRQLPGHLRQLRETGSTLPGVPHVVRQPRSRESAPGSLPPGGSREDLPTIAVTNWDGEPSRGAGDCSGAVGVGEVGRLLAGSERGPAEAAHCFLVGLTTNIRDPPALCTTAALPTSS